jgi:hypothetical protein
MFWLCGAPEIIIFMVRDLLKLLIPRIIFPARILQHSEFI